MRNVVLQGIFLHSIEQIIPKKRYMFNTKWKFQFSENAPHNYMVRTVTPT